MVEDMETSYNKEYGGGFRAASSFAEYTKPMVCCHSSSLDATPAVRVPSLLAPSSAGQHTWRTTAVDHRGPKARHTVFMHLAAHV